jgi:hypothetical protein
MAKSKLTNSRIRNNPSRKRAQAILRRASAGLAIVVACSFGLSPSDASHKKSGGGAVNCIVGSAANPNPPAVQGPSPIVNFAPGSIIIPMDNCYQRNDKATSTLIETAVDETYGASESMATVACDTSAGDIGSIAAYLMIRKLIAAGVPVSWALRDNKAGWADFDVAIAAGVGGAVKHMTRTGVTTDLYAGLGIIKYAGAPFIIAEADAAAAMVVLAANGGADMDAIDFHLVVESFDAPVYKTMRAIPTFAVLDFTGLFDGGDLGKMNSTLADAGLVAGVDFDYINAAQMQAGDLLTGGYTLAFMPSYKGGPPSNAAETASLLALENFAAGGGSIVAQEDAIPSLEGTGTFSTTTGVYTATTLPAISSAWAHSVGGIHYNRISGIYGANTASEVLSSDDYSDPASQWGGSNWNGIGGAASNWISSCEFGYRDGVRRQLYTSGQAAATNDVDFASWKHYNDDQNLGRIYYLGGKNWRKNAASGFRLLLNTILVTASDTATSSVEASRSSPIIATVSGSEYQFSGTFEVVTPRVVGPQYGSNSDDDTFEFPHIKGHFRATDTSALVLNTVTSTNGIELFDTATALASMTTDAKSGCGPTTDGVCRHIFTNDGNDKEMLVEDNLSAFKSDFIDTIDFTDNEIKTLIQRIHAGFDTGGGTYIPALGGVDRSTVAVIGASPSLGVGRATIAYFGALDGMIHAVCADFGTAPCGTDDTYLGKEIWAFMPRAQLKNVSTNQTRIDGSPKVSDVFADFGSGTKETRTVLTFQSGTNDAAATYAIDITDPVNPDVLWEHVTPGGGMSNAIGVINVPGVGLTSITFIQTSLGSAAANAGMYLAAVETGTGNVVWSSTQVYPPARGFINGAASAVADVPTTGMPGGVSVFASVDGDLVDTLLVPTLWGSVWQLDPVTGDSKVGTAVCNTPTWQTTPGCTPLFQFEDDYHPVGASVSVYRERGTQALHAVVVTGGFTDNDQPSASIWAPSSVKQLAVSFALDVATDDGVIQAAADPSVGLYIDLGPGNRAFSPAVILGNEIFITTDSADVFGVGAPTGLLTQVNLSTGAIAPTFPKAIASGFASVGVSATSNAVYTGDGALSLKTDITGYDADGITVEQPIQKVARFLWLRSR